MTETQIPHILKTYAIVPAYNAAVTVAQVIIDLKKQVDHVIVIDDGSTDQTYNIAKNNGALVLRHSINLGQGAALKTGFEYALICGADIFVTFDSDAQHNAEDIPALIKPIIENKAQVVLGSRFLGKAFNIPKSRKRLLQGAIIFSKLTSGMNTTDTHNGLRAFSREAIKKIKLTMNRMAYASELMDEIQKNKLTWVEVPTHVYYTEHSLSRGQRDIHAIKVLAEYFWGKAFRWTA